ncbi:DUF2946 domain-containing protein [Yokenella regensburgei]|uniref:DUF2946 domain-containing protein n=1 Tax=Yokenella regensburgei TaxID=158877 RepID=UPI003F5CF250
MLLLMAFGWLFIQSQVAIAAHDCDLNVQGATVMTQHYEHVMTSHAQERLQHGMKAPLCDKHCVPDVVQKETGHQPVVALPVSMTLAVAKPVSVALVGEGWALTPPAAGPPATIRFCRFRE